MKDIREQIRSLGKPASWYHGVVTTMVEPENILQIKRELPNLQSILLIFGPRATPRQALPGIPEISSTKAGGEPSGYSAAAYFAIVQFLTERNIGLDKTLFHVPNADQAVTRAILDMQWFQSSIIVRLLAQTQFNTDIFFKWAKLLGDSSQPLQALQFAHLLRTKMHREKLAQLAVSSLLKMDCADPLTIAWTDSLPIPKNLRKKTKKDVQQAAAHQKANSKEQLDANLELIEKRWPKAAQAIRDSTPQGICVGRLPDVPWLVNLKTGIVDRAPYPVFFQRTEGLLPVVNTPHDPRGLVPNDRLLQYTRQIPGIIIGSLIAFDAIANFTMNRLTPQIANMQQPIYLVNRNPVIANLVLSNVDLTSVFEEDRIQCSFGPNAVQDIKTMFQNNTQLLLPAVKVSTDEDVDTALDEILQQRNDSVNKYCSSWEKIYPKDFSQKAYEAISNQGQHKLRVLLVTSLFSTVVQYVARDLAHAFSQLGADVHIAKENKGIERCDTRVVAHDIYEYRPHLLVIMDHLRPEYQGLLPDNLPWVAWNQDPLPKLFDKKNIEKLGPNDFNYTVSSLWVNQFRALGYKHMEMLPFAANTDIYNPVDDKLEVRDEVAFITNMDPTQDFFPSYHGLQQKLTKQFDSQDISYAKPELMSEKILQALGFHPGQDQLNDLVDASTWRFERWYDRRRVLRWLLKSGFPIGLYGRGWDKDPEFSPMARGWIEQGQQLAQLYRTSRAVIHVNTLINTHQRVFECLASGGFVLARRTPYDDLPGELSSCLEPGKEIELFGNAQELSEKLERVFSDNEWRSGLIEAGQKRVFEEHSYLARARKILNDVQIGLRRQKARAA